jgi:hypothetical protein
MMKLAAPAAATPLRTSAVDRISTLPVDMSSKTSGFMMTILRVEMYGSSTDDRNSEASYETYGRFG